MSDVILWHHQSSLEYHLGTKLHTGIMSCQKYNNHRYNIFPVYFNVKKNTI